MTDSRPTILITGCSSGIGACVARGLRGHGWRVFASCRKQSDCDRLIGEGFESPRIDYADPDSIQAGLDEVLAATGGTLHALFNNGAIGIPGAVEDLPAGALREIFEVNLFGLHDLTVRVIPIMRAQGHGRIIQHSSVLGLVTLRWRAAYNATKYALEGLTDTLRIEMRDTPIHITSLNTGPVTSKLREKSVPYFEKWVDWESSARRAQYEQSLLARLYEKKSGTDPFELPPQAVLEKVIHALESPRPRPRYFITYVPWIMVTARRILPTRALDWLISKG